METKTQNLSNVFKSGETSIIFDCSVIKFPATVTLKSSDVTRKIELSTNDGLEYFSPQIDITTATMRIVVLNTAVTDIRFTGVTNDILSVVY